MLAEVCTIYRDCFAELRTRSLRVVRSDGKDSQPWRRRHIVVPVLALALIVIIGICRIWGGATTRAADHRQLLEAKDAHIKDLQQQLQKANQLLGAFSLGRRESSDAEDTSDMVKLQEELMLLRSKHESIQQDKTNSQQQVSLLQAELSSLEKARSQLQQENGLHKTVPAQDARVVSPYPNPNGLHKTVPAQARVVSPFVASNACSTAQMAQLGLQLPPDQCNQYKGAPWRKLCSFSAATSCPNPIWLHTFYRRVHKQSIQISRLIIDRATDSIPQERSFVAVSVGCNRGDDAVNIMRLGAADPRFATERWSAAFVAENTTLASQVCGQALPQFDLSGLPKTSTRSHIHCIEPLGLNANALRRSAHELGLDVLGFHVHQAAVAQTNGAVLFPTAKIASLGLENKGLDDCDTHTGKSKEWVQANCEFVEMYNLDTFDQKFLDADVPINVLSIDVEGYDIDVLLGAKEHTLRRVQYLEFEYNWMGSWQKRHKQNQKLSDVIDMLDSNFGFTCYWAGDEGNIWRITGCWQEHYDLLYWSNVACVNRNLEAVNELADIMEQMFLQTLEKHVQFCKTTTHRTGKEGTIECHNAIFNPLTGYNS